MSTKYLYGATVDGIQKYIFESNRLRDIIGASTLVHQLCTSMFDEFDHDGKSIVRAAGNIKHLYDTREACQRAVRDFPRKVSHLAAGLDISQAVVEMDDGMSFSDAVKLLETRLRTARNKPGKPIETGLSAIERSRLTGRPAVCVADGEYLDANTRCRRLPDNTTRALSEKAFGLDNLKNHELAYEIDEITEKNSWIAIVHADGNGLGLIVQIIGNAADILALFSKTLDEATRKAANDAFDKVMTLERAGGVIPMRPIVLDGDDMTVVIRGDLAIKYTMEFIQAFESRTRQLFTERIVTPWRDKLSDSQVSILSRGLTACAGIAFIKSSYPFYFGYQLAEELCSAAKKEAKLINPELAPSCLMFHKVQDSFVEDYSEIAARELTPCEGLTYQFGPYYMHEQPGKWTVDRLLDYTTKLADDDSSPIKNSLRRWLSTISMSGLAAAAQLSKRIMDVHPEAAATLRPLLDTSTGATPVYDILSLTSICKTTTR